MAPRWPNQTRAAVSLTYDDGMQSQLEVAAPQLREVGLRATFFINEVSDDAPWVALRTEGHELAGHTQHHPCPRSFEVPTTPSEELDLAKMALELDGDLAQLRRLGQPPPYSFAYPCGVTWVGAKQSYLGLVRQRFFAARLADPGASAARQDQHKISARFGLDTVEQLLAAVDLAVEDGGWLVLGFHGIGAGWLITDSDVHLEFLRALARRRDVWIAPFGAVAQHLAAQRPAGKTPQ